MFLYEYDANGNRTAVKYANGIVVTYDYDALNRLISEKALDKDGGLVAQYEYTLGEAGERTKITERGLTVEKAYNEIYLPQLESVFGDAVKSKNTSELSRIVEYTYDELYRLTGEKITNADGNVTEYTYTYDAVSNRLTKNENGKETVYSYNALNQLVKENDTVYTYDDAGNLISTEAADKTSTYVYNASNKLLRATVMAGGETAVEEYTYNYDGSRLSKKTVKGEETSVVKYFNDRSVLTNVIAETDNNNNELCYYTIGADLISMERGGSAYIYLYDGHGNVRGLIDADGKLTDTFNYDAFGNMLDRTGNTENSYLYCGEQQDDTTGLYYLRARYMNPETGTFISMDTYGGSVFDPVSLHKYLYANANPVMGSDPSGYFSLAECGVVTAIQGVLQSTTGMAIIKALGFGALGAVYNAYHQWRTTGKIDWSQVLDSFIMGSLLSVFFAFCGILAIMLESAIIFYALGVSCAVFTLMSLATALADGEAGYFDLFLIDLFFAWQGAKGTADCFNAGYNIQTASNTSNSTTNTSTDNTNNANNNSSNNTQGSNSNGSGNKGGKSGGRWGNQATRALNKEVADILTDNGYEVTGGGTYKPEEYLPGPNGARKGSNYVDVTVQSEDGSVTYRINTVDTYADGTTPTTRESTAAASINAKTPGEPDIILIPKGSTTAQIIEILRGAGLIP